jgi:hypothetical protein
VQAPKDPQKEARWQVAPAQDLADLVDAASAVLKIPIEYVRSLVTGPLTLRLSSALQDEGLLYLAHLTSPPV